ncbi:MAG: helix-turn-helix domain-containing protein [Lachnospira sp.]
MEDTYSYSTPEIITKWGEQFRVYRTALGLTLVDVAEQSGLSLMTVQRFENGTNKDISLSTLVRLLRTIHRLEDVQTILPPIPESPYYNPAAKPIKRVRHKNG